VTEEDETVLENAGAATTMDRLRDRTDELELIISSLTIFALFSVPNWLFDKFAASFTHISSNVAIAGTLGTSLLTGACYGLGTCFVVHLMARAYWVGLIGLRSAFPEGIRWDQIRTMGPLTREHFRRTAPEIGSVIAGADRLASSLFAVISVLTLGVLWLGTIVIVALVGSGIVGTSFGFRRDAILMTLLGLLVIFVGIPLLIHLLDRQLAARSDNLRDSRPFRALISGLRRISSIAYPRRLILPVQLTLQSNLPSFVFVVAMTAAVIIIVVLGNFRVAAWSRFTVSGEFDYLTRDDVQAGFRSTHYEDLPSDLDRLRGWPRINSFTQRGAFLRLFLPYQPLRDNVILEALCGERKADEPAAPCLQQLWAASVDGRDLGLSDFMPAERGDLSMRGLLGVLPLDGLSPGLHKLEVLWNPRGTISDMETDDQYQDLRRTYQIPFLFSPEFELSLDAAGKATAPGAP
jgi:hypothetical protein